MPVAEETELLISQAGHTASAAVVDVRDSASAWTLADRSGLADVLVVTPSANVRERFLDLTDDESIGSLI